MAVVHETKPQVSPLPALSLRRLRDAVLAADPACACDPELFTGPAGIDPDDELPGRGGRADRGGPGGVRGAARCGCRAWPTRCGHAPGGRGVGRADPGGAHRLAPRPPGRPRRGRLRAGRRMAVA